MSPLTRLDLYGSSQAGDELGSAFSTTLFQILQKARFFFLILLGTTLFCKTGHEVSITLFGPLQDLSRVATSDWDPYLYYRLDTV